MKKVVTLLLTFTFAISSFAVSVNEVAGVFNGSLNIGGEMYNNKDVYILPGVADNSITFVLPDFKYGKGNLGNIVLPNIPMDESGQLTLDNATLFIKAISERATITIVNGLEDGGVVYNSVISASQAQVLLTIAAPSLPEPIFVLFAGTKVANKNYAMSNGGFEGNWSGNEPSGWHSFITATGDFATFVQSADQFKQSSDVRPGSAGSHSVMLLSKMVLGARANGNCTNGRINAGSTTASDAGNNYNFSDPNNTGYNTPFVGSPDSLVFWAKYIPADKNPSNSVNKARANAVITTNARYQDPETGSYASVRVANAAINYSATSDMGWQRLSTPFNYTSLDPSQAAYILITFSTNAEPGGGSSHTEGGIFNKKDYLDNLYLDDAEIIYNHGLKSLTIDGTEVSFTDGAATLSQVYSDSEYDLEAATDGKASQSFIAYDEASASIYIYVVAQNYSQAQNYSVYTIRMAQPNKDTQYSYEVSACDDEPYTDANFSNLTESGTYNVTIPNTQGGDSLITLTLTMNHAYVFPTEASVKINETYTWQGSDYIYSAPGKYADTITYTTVAGCDSICILALTVEAEDIVVEEALTICQNEELVWHEKVLPTAEPGIFVLYDSLLSVFGKDSVHVLTLTVNPIYIFPTEASVKINETYTWQGSDYIYSAPGKYADTITYTTVAGCDSICVLALTVVAEDIVVEEALTACQNEELVWHEKVLPTAEPGIFVHYDSLLSVFGKDSVHVLTLTVLPSYQKESTLYVSSENTNEYVWPDHANYRVEYPSGKVFEAQNSVMIIGEGTYILSETYTMLNGCDSTIILHLIVSEIPVTYGSYKTTICQGEAFVYEGVTYSDSFDGEVHVSTPNVYGGDSIVHLVVNALPSPLIDEYRTILVGEEGAWEGYNLSTFPVGERELKAFYYTENGCDSIMVLHLTVIAEQIPTGWTDTNASHKHARKVWSNGRLYIIREDETIYDLLGTKIQ